MKFEKTEVWGFEHAVRGMRNPLESWNKSDSKYKNGEFILGEKDIDLMQRLIKAGSPDRKFMRQIFVSVDITAPLYYFKELDTYKISTVANSTSTMHKLSTTSITIDCFEMDDYKSDLVVFVGEPYCVDTLLDEEWTHLINVCETLRLWYLETKDKRYWKELIRILPQSWLQTRTITMNYENIYSMIRQRRSHKLNEWSGKDDQIKPNFISWARTLPYAKELLFVGLED